MEYQRVTRSAAARTPTARVAPYESPEPSPGARRGAAARQLAQQQQQARAAAAAAQQQAALQAEAEALAQAQMDEYLATAAQKPAPVDYAQPVNAQAQFAELSESLRSEVAATMANSLAQLTSTIQTSLVRAVAPLEVPTGLSSGATAAVAQTLEAMSEQMKGADTGECMLAAVFSRDSKSAYTWSTAAAGMDSWERAERNNSSSL